MTVKTSPHIFSRAQSKEVAGREGEDFTAAAHAQVGLFHLASKSSAIFPINFLLCF